MTSDTMTVVTNRKLRPDLVATPWNCKECGACLGGIRKSDKGWYLVLSRAPNTRIYGDAEITCQFCGKKCEWCWNEHALKRVLRARERRI